MCSEINSKSSEERIKKLHSLIDEVLASDPKRQEFYLGALDSLVKLLNDNPDPADVKLIQVSLNELVDSAILFKPYRSVMKVSIFGSARTKPDHPNYKIAEDTARKIVDAGMMVITGAGPGIMEAGNKGAGVHGFGLNIELPFENEPNEYIGSDPKLLHYRYFFARKLAFIKEAFAIALFPGGFGTQDEAFEVLTLVQTGRSAPMPVLLINFDKSNYWSSWRAFVKEQLLERDYISSEDLDIYEEVTTVDALISRIKKFYSVYHSVRYLDDITAIRLEKTLDENVLFEINKRFSHLLISGDFCMKSAAEVPGEELLFSDKPRLVFHFNMANYGGLYRLIKFINDSED
jgi:uncharacterized protein (TIGR00730 family)